MYLSDVAAEHAIISGIFQYGKDAYCEVGEYVDSTSFTIDLNQIIFTCMSYIYGDNIDAKLDVHSILSAANELGLGNKLASENNYLQRAINLKVELPTVVKSAKKLKKLLIARNLLDTCDVIKDEVKHIKGDESISSILGIAENKILDFANNISGNNEDSIVTIGAQIEEYVEYLFYNPSEIVGISTGYPIFDKAIGRGVRKKTMSIIGARPGVGKTLLCDNIGMNVSGCEKKPRPILVLDTEMDIQGHWPRLLANLSGVSIDCIETGNFRNKQSLTDRVYGAAKKIKSFPYHYINIAGKDFDEVLSIMRRWLMKEVGYNENGETNDCLIIYDYLKLMDSEGIKSGNLAEYQLLGFQATTLTNFAQKYNVPILSFIQLNRDGLTKDTSDVIAQSDRILWFASSLSIFKPKTKEEIEQEDITNGNRKLFVLKSRFGGGLEDGDYINFMCKKECAKITELKTNFEVKAAIKKYGKGGFDVQNEFE